MKVYHYIYKITNSLNGHFYFGVHSTKNLDDGYMGSGVRLTEAFQLFGKENFTKEIVLFFDSREEALAFEACTVTESLTKRYDCYNTALGGNSFASLSIITSGKSCYKDKKGNKFYTSTSDPRVLSGELVPFSKGKSCYKDKHGRKIHTTTDDPRVLSGELIPLSTGVRKEKSTYLDRDGRSLFLRFDDPLVLNDFVTHVNKGMASYKDRSGVIVHTSVNDPRVLSGELVGHSTGKAAYLDFEGNKIHTTTDDPRVLSGELISVNKGKTTYLDRFGNKVYTRRDDPRVLSGELLNYSIGRKMGQYAWVTDGVNQKRVRVRDLDDFLKFNEDWRRGRN